jgi:hypothetical protein
VGGQQSTRSLPHLAELFRLADQANLLEQPELAVRRMKVLLCLYSIDLPLTNIVEACARRGIRATSPGATRWHPRALTQFRVS